MIEIRSSSELSHQKSGYSPRTSTRRVVETSVGDVNRLTIDHRNAVDRRFHADGTGAVVGATEVDAVAAAAVTHAAAGGFVHELATNPWWRGINHCDTDGTDRACSGVIGNRELNVRHALRARIVLRCSSCLSNATVAEKLGVSRVTVGKWRGRFVRHRLEGLFDEPRVGAPRKIGDDVIEDVVIRTLETTPKNATHWSRREMAREVGLGRETIGRIWRAFGLAPHRSETLFAALDVASGKVIGKCYRRHRAKEFLKFLKQIDDEVPEELELHIVLDNYATHKTPTVLRCLERRCKTVRLGEDG